MCGKRSLGEIEETWWWNEEIKDIIARKKAAFKELSRFLSEESKDSIQTFKKSTRIIVTRAMRMKAKQKLNNLYQNSKSVF